MTVALVEPTDRAVWLEARRQGIGGSDVASIAGLDPWRTPRELYDEKLGLVADREPTPAMERGRHLEDVAARLYAERTGRGIRRQPLRKHAEYEWMIGNVDRQILTPTAPDIRQNAGTGVLECKVPGLREFGRLTREGLRDYYILQMQHYLGVYGYRWGSFSILNTERWKHLTFDVEFDEGIWNQLVELEGRFWNDHVLAHNPPADLAAPLIKLPEYTGSLVTRSDADWAAAVELLRDAKDLITTAGQLESEAKDRFKELLGGYAIAEGAGLRVYFREMAGRKTLDKKALQGAGLLDPIAVGTVLADLGISLATFGTLADRLKACAADIATYEKQGKPFPEFRSYFLRGEQEEGSHGDRE